VYGRSTTLRESPVTLGPGGLALVLALAGVFAVVGAEVGIPVVFAALLGGIGGTASLLVHEYGHVRAARRLPGIRCTVVSLVWFGAATRFEGAYASGREQVRVAIAGPAASFALALSLLGLCFAPMPLTLREGILALALVNAALAVVNLIPAPPLDGYKVLVGLLWCAMRSEQKARRIIRRVGLGWAVLELPFAAVLLAERPRLGVVVLVLAASVFAQKRLATRPVEVARSSR
jgi:Zn-dependent protease